MPVQALNYGRVPTSYWCRWIRSPPRFSSGRTPAASGAEQPANRCLGDTLGDGVLSGRDNSDDGDARWLPPAGGQSHNPGHGIHRGTQRTRRDAGSFAAQQRLHLLREFSGDEADNRRQVIQLSQPVPVYVDNYLGVPVGTLVPVGYYDRTGPCGCLPATGSSCRSWARPTARAHRYTRDRPGRNSGHAGGQRLHEPRNSRVWPDCTRPARPSGAAPVPHFSSWDFNYGSAAPFPTDPTDPGTNPNATNATSRHRYGTLNFSAQTFAEQIPLVGVPFALNYSSARVPDYRVDNQITFPVAWQPPADPCGARPTGRLRPSRQLLRSADGIAWKRTSRAATSKPIPGPTSGYDLLGWRDGYGRLVAGSAWPHRHRLRVPGITTQRLLRSRSSDPVPSALWQHGNMIGFRGQVGIYPGRRRPFQRLFTMPTIATWGWAVGVPPAAPVGPDGRDPLLRGWPHP